jgi:ribosomal protein L11 methyltransferase
MAPISSGNSDNPLDSAWFTVTLAATTEAVDWVRTAIAAVQPMIPFAVAPVSPAQDADWDYDLTLWFPETWAGRQQWSALSPKLVPLERSGLIDGAQIDPAAAPPKIATTPVHHLGRFVILPVGMAAAPFAPALPIWLQPSPSFGSGYHPATSLCLQLLEQYLPQLLLQSLPTGGQVLDLGTGSGILGLAAARLGAQVTALDNDPVAIQACQQAILDNGLTQQMQAQVGSLGAGQQFGHWLGDDYGGGVPGLSQFKPPMNPPTAWPTQFAVIVANLLARLHLALVPDYIASLAPQGWLITAGYTQDYQPTLEEAFSAAGLHLQDQAKSGDWLAQIHCLQP